MVTEVATNLAENITEINQNTIDTTETERFLALFGGSETPHTWQVFVDPPSKKAKYGKEGARIIQGSFREQIIQLIYFNKNDRGIYLTINITDGRGRKKTNIVRIRAVWVDLDGSPLEPILKCGLPPHAIIESSPGRYHAYWLVVDCEIDQFEPIQHALANIFNGDHSVCDPSRVMRVPGFLHLKKEPFRSRILEIRNAPPYPIQDIVSGFKLQMEPKRPKASQPKEAHHNHDGFLSPWSERFLKEKMLANTSRNGSLMGLAGRLRQIGLPMPYIGHMMKLVNDMEFAEPLEKSELEAMFNQVSKYERGALDLRKLEQSSQSVETKSILDLQKSILPDTPWIAVNLLMPGLVLLVGKPKVGKSWLVLGLALDVARGLRALDYFEVPQPVGVLLLALEDSDRRLQNRLKQLLPDSDAPANVRYATAWPTLDPGRIPNGLGAIEAHLDKHPDTKLVVLDTIQKVRAAKKSVGSDYEQDYRFFEALQRMAIDRGIVIFGLHHQKKMAENDVFDSVLGSQAIMGVSDACLILEKARGENDGLLHVTGRDIPEDGTFSMTFDKATCSWSCNGRQNDIKRRKEWEDILDAMPSTPCSISDLVEATGLKYTTISERLRVMLKNGWVDRSVQRGRYVKIDIPF
jgi:hypothetical protein